MDHSGLRAMQTLAAECWRLSPKTVNAAANVGVLAWDHGAPEAEDEPPKQYLLWREGDRVVAWGVIFPPTMATLRAGEQALTKTTLLWQVHPAHVDLVDDLLDWFSRQVPDAVRLTNVRASNADARRHLEAHGYTHDPSAPFDLMNTRDLTEIARPVVRSGYSLKTMAEVNDIEKRVAVHRAAWEPSSLTVEKYAAIMSTWPYRAEFDFVVEAPDGTLACSALGWYDEANGVGEFEPVGTHPEHRRLGLASNLMLFGMQRFRDAGATHAIVGCRGDDDYPIPKAVYHGIGFQEISRDLPFVAR